MANHQTLVYQSLKEEVQSIDFKELFKDAKMLKRVHKILTRDSKPEEKKVSGNLDDEILT